MFFQITRSIGDNLNNIVIGIHFFDFIGITSPKKCYETLCYKELA